VDPVDAELVDAQAVAVAAFVEACAGVVPAGVAFDAVA
jgi:hypothetical protein